MLFLFLIVCGVIAIIIVKVCILSCLSFMTLNFCNVLNSPALIELKGEMNPKPAPSGVAQR